MSRYDIIVVGAGMGGSAFAWALRQTDLRIAVIERGVPVKPAPENWDPDEVISRGRYNPDELWYDSSDRPFVPRVYYTWGGSSKFFGGTAFRLRERDFHSHEFAEGSTVSWPFTYTDVAPFYDIAEAAMCVHGEAGTDPTEPPRGSYPFPPLVHEPEIDRLRRRLELLGLHPFPLPIAVHQGSGGHCRKGSPCDGFPCKIRAKLDGENAFLRPALRESSRRASGGAAGGISVLSATRVVRILDDGTGQRVTGVLVQTDEGVEKTLEAEIVVLAAGTVNSAALLLNSATSHHPRGLANGSDQVGRNFMAHNNTVLMALSPWRRNPTQFQKTLAFNDFYMDGGNVQMRGKILPHNLIRSGTPCMRLFARTIAARSFDFWVMSEDLPDPDNRVEIRSDGSIRLHRRLTNVAAHRELVRRVRSILRRAGLPVILERPPVTSAIQHQVGTLRMGADPDTSVVSPAGHTHEIDNLYVVDGSVFPSSAGVNPALTIAANALRVAEGVRRRMC